jgi:hypothetical protein
VNIIRSHVYSIGHEYESNIYLLLEIGAAAGGGGDCLVAVERLFDLSITTRLVIRGATQTLLPLLFLDACAAPSPSPM